MTNYNRAAQRRCWCPDRWGTYEIDGKNVGCHGVTMLGWFHGFFPFRCGEYESYPVAIVEREDGTITEIGAELIRFADSVGW